MDGVYSSFSAISAVLHVMLLILHIYDNGSILV